MLITQRLESARDSAVAMVPVGYERGLRRWFTVVTGMAVILLLDVNQRMIHRFGPDLPAVWDTKSLPWLAEIEAAYPEIRAEFEDYLRGAGELPEVARFSGLEPDSSAAKRSVPLGAGHWRSIVLKFMGDWYQTVDDFPVTTRLTRGRPGVQTVGFSCLDPHSHIVEHRDPNKGALRYQLPILVPGDLGDCRIRIGDEIVPWREGECILFDLNLPHEVWNDSDGFRVLMAGEVVMPLPFPLSVLNRFSQWAYRYFPSYRGVRERTELVYQAQLAQRAG